jgi:1-acyl-sn-glycerol-3-phosphate acyltransferase
LYPAFLFLLYKEQNYIKANKLRAFWAHCVFLFTGLRYHIDYRYKPKKNKSYIVCPNHFSYLDIPTVVLIGIFNYRFMAKVELNNIPIFNIFFKTIDIPVDRGNKSAAYKAIKQAEESIDRNLSLIIFPEGTIGAHQPHLLRFKNGPFKLAIEKQTPILPVTFVDNWNHLYVDEKIYGKPGLLRIVVHEPIETTGLTTDDIETLKEKTYNVMHAELSRHWNMK